MNQPLPNTEDNLTNTEEEWVEARAFKKERYKRLMLLLQNSKMYSKLLKDKLVKHETVARKKNILSPKKAALGSKKLNDDFNFDGVLSKENIEHEAQKKQESLTVHERDENLFRETKVTDLGVQLPYKQPALLEGGVMRDYQLKGLEWMKNLHENEVNGILADEMGLGKTIQIISFICQMIEENVKGPFLVIAPLSTLGNWMTEFETFAPKVPVLLYHGNKENRKELFREILKTSKVGDKSVYKVVIASYRTTLIDEKSLKKIIWYYLIIDEGHVLKNYRTKLARVLQSFNTIGRMLLTGTPLQNDILELWSLLHFLLPEIFSSLEDFESLFDVKDLQSNGAEFLSQKFNLNLVKVLQEILHPFLLRREKKDINLNLPPKKEILIYCPMTPFQKELYKATMERNIEFFSKKIEEDLEEPCSKRKCFLRSPYAGTVIETNQSSRKKKKDSKVEEEKETYLTSVVFTNPQMQLRKIVNHPYLIKYPLKMGTEELRIDEELITQSGKMLVLDALLSRLKVRGHKVVIFSYFKLVLNIIEDYAIMKGYKYCRIDGDLNSMDREQELQNYRYDETAFLFLLSERAGGLGINITVADTVILYDSDWNPQVNLQCEDRCHRIGQTKPVIVYILCVNGTIDERIIERGVAKRRLEKMILQKGKFTYDSKSQKKKALLDLQELKELFESSTPDVVIKSNGCVLTDQQLEFLLDRSNMSEKFSQDDSKSKVFKILNNSKY